MGLLDPYVTVAEYRAAVGSAATGSDTELAASIAGTSRLIELELGIADGGFNSHSATYLFDGSGRNVLRLRDRALRQYYLQSITADCLKIDSDLDGSFDDYTLDTDDAWVRGLPENAAAQGKPWDALELRPLSTATLTVFPKLAGCVQIAGVWGWPQVPDPIRQLVIGLTLDLRRARFGGSGAGMSGIDVHALSPETYWMWREAQRLYSRRIPAFA